MTAKLIDLQVIRNGFNCTVTIKELFKAVVNVIDSETSLIEKAIEEQDWISIKHISHKLNGLSGYSGAFELKNAAMELENSFKEGPTPLIENLTNNLLKRAIDTKNHIKLLLETSL